MPSIIVTAVLLFLVVAVTSSNALSESELMPMNATLPSIKYFDQDVDHSDKAKGTFKQLYYESLKEGVNSTNNVKFLFVGGNSHLALASVSLNFMSQLADQFIADKYALEHRYYGLSQPMDDISSENLKFLTIEQTLDDIAKFLKFINNQDKMVHNKWILFGSSYAGNLVVWAREKYPELIFGAVASGAPVEAQMNFKGYLKTVSDIIGRRNEKCKTTIKEAMQDVVKAFKKKQGMKELKNQFMMCKIPVGNFDKYSLTSYIADVFSETVLHNIKTPSSDRVSALCNDLLARKGNKLHQLASVVKDVYLGNSKRCFDYSYKSNPIISTTMLNPYNNKRQWYYQMCTELGFFQSTSAQDQPFAHALPLSYFTKLCSDAFGKKFNEDFIRRSIDKTNEKYKGNNMNGASNVIMVYGEEDPWKQLGPKSLPSKTSLELEIKGGWHCEDFNRENDMDSNELKAARIQIRNRIELWISQ